MFVIMETSQQFQFGFFIFAFMLYVVNLICC